MSVTVVIPTLNRAGTLRRALESVTTQTLAPSQIVVVDNASTDDTPDVVRDFDVTYIRQPNRVPMFDNWRTAVESAKSDWVKFLPDDDELLPGCLEALVSASEGARVVQCAAWMGGQVVYTEAAALPGAVAEMVEQGRMSANPVTALLRTDDALAAWDLFWRLSEQTQASAFGPNLLLMYGAVLRDWAAHRHIPEPLVRIDGFDGVGDQRSYTLRVMAENHGLWRESYRETYALLNEMASEDA